MEKSMTATLYKIKKGCMIPPITISRVMAGKMAHVELGSSQEVEMRQSIVMLLMACRSPDEPLARAVESVRRTLAAVASAICKVKPGGDLTPRTSGNGHPSVRVFASADEWLKYYFLFYDIEALRLYVNQLFEEIEGNDRRLKKCREEQDRAMDCERLREKIPHGMQVRMRAEVREHLEGFAASTLISKGALQKVISLNLADLKGVPEGEYRAIEPFQPNPDIRLEHGSFKYWLAHYMQEYSVDAITRLLFDWQETHVQSNVARFMRESAELSSKDWHRVVTKYPELTDKRDEFHRALCEIVMKDINDICERYVYGDAAYSLLVKIRPEHVTNIKFVCRLDDDPKISYRIDFKHCESGVDMSANTSSAVFIRRIIASMNIVPPLAVAEGLISWGSVGET